MADDQRQWRGEDLLRRSVAYFQGLGGYSSRSASGTWPLARRVFGVRAARLWLREARAHPVLMTGLLALWAAALAVIVLQAVR